MSCRDPALLAADCDKEDALSQALVNRKRRGFSDLESEGVIL